VVVTAVVVLTEERALVANRDLASHLIDGGMLLWTQESLRCSPLFVTSRLFASHHRSGGSSTRLGRTQSRCRKGR
jgi:hypothetical protein